MPKAAVIIYNLAMQKVAMLENAFNIGYQMPYNGLWTASFQLPANDEKNDECKPLYFVELYDQNERIELFRITPNSAKRSGDGLTITYSCEHVLATLLDDVMFQYHTVGNLGVHTGDVLGYILSKQLVSRWEVGAVDFTREFEYNWENENLLAAAFSVPKPFGDDFMWTYDTTVYPWKLNLVAPSNAVSAYIRYAVNLRGIDKTTDPTNLCTRLYGLGYGEGVNQLTFSEINGGVPYIDSDTQGDYGIVSRIFADRRFTSSETLKARCQALLNELKTPRMTYSVSAAELYQLTKDPIDRFRTGGMVRVQDAELGIDIVARVVNVRKGDIFGAPGEVEIEIANRPEDLAGTISDLANRQRIGEVYAQGATNIDSHDFADNADPAHQATLRFYIPEETARINKVLLNYKSEAFRGYSKGAAAGGGTTESTSSGGGTTESTSSGGGTTATSSSGGGTTQTTSSGGGSTPTTSTEPSQTPTTTTEPTQTPTTSTKEAILNSSGGGLWFSESGYTSGIGGTNFRGEHNHGLNNGEVLMRYDGTPVTFVESGTHSHEITLNHSHTVTIPAHAHTVTIPAHSHGVTIPAHSHSVNIPAHSHDVSIPSHTHDVTVPAHSHSVTIPNHSHTVTVPNHTHDMVYGIFEGPTPTQVTVTVDGVSVPGTAESLSDVDIIPYLSKDAAGKVTRGWHEIKIAPNDLGRISANVVIQLFVQSRGGGDY